MQEGLDNLAECKNQVDYILTHCIYTSLLRIIDSESELYEKDYLTDYLQKIRQTAAYKQWAFAHYHMDQNFQSERAVCLFEQIVRIL